MRKILTVAAALVLCWSAAAVAQVDLFSGGAADEGELTVTAEIVPAEGDEPAKLSITAEIPSGWHIFSVTQKPGGPLRTKITLTESDHFRLLEETYAADPAPHVTEYPEAWPGLPVEEHEERVTWQVPIELAAGVSAADVAIEGKVTAQRCKAELCLAPKGYPFTARFPEGAERRGNAVVDRPAAEAGAAPPEDAPPAFVGSYNNPMAKAEIRGEVTGQAAPGDSVALRLTATPEGVWHVYAWSDGPSTVLSSKPTLIEVVAPAGWRVSAPATESAIREQRTVESGTLRYHEGRVAWTLDIDVPADASPGDYTIAGIIGYQTCFEEGCMPPAAAQFAATVKVQDGASAAAAIPLTFVKSSYRVAERVAAGDPLPDVPIAGVRSASSPSGVQVVEVGDQPSATAAGGPIANLRPRDFSGGLAGSNSLVTMLVAAFLGGLILNVMPCVLPVIGLKILSFAQQAGENRKQAFLLNVWYSAGIIAVFMVLAVLGSAANLGLGNENLGWGEQFTSTEFNVFMAALVFAMAISFIGVWEIPIPGFVGSGKASELAAREGAGGAFSKGIVTTILATPCSGPFLGPVFGFSVSQPPAVSFGLFFAIGLGMSAPYLLIGAFPGLIRFLPKPGAWMDTFKQVMGFVLLGAVVFLLSFIEDRYVLPTLALLIGIWAGCWWIGRTPLWADFGKKARAYGVGATIAMAVGLVAFNFHFPGAKELPWRPYSPQALSELTSQGQTVMVDFTADWCATCQVNSAVALNRSEVYALVDANGVQPLLADWTDGSEEIKALLTELDSNSIPVLAIFPAGQPSEPIVLRDLVSKRQVLEALREAGPSRTVVQTASRD